MSTPDFEALLDSYGHEIREILIGRGSQIAFVNARNALRAYVQSLTPVWTDTVPTEPGWYWYREQPVFAERPVEIQNDNGRFYVFGGKLGEGWIDKWPGQWAGPLPEPQEPNKA